MVSSSPKIDQILAMVKELSHRERIGLIQRIMQVFLPAEESTAESEQSSTNGVSENQISEPYFSVHPQRHIMPQEQEAFDEMIDELRANYLGQYVAVHQGEIVDHDEDITTLCNRTGESHPDQVVLTRQVLSESEPELRWRSVRLLDNH